MLLPVAYTRKTAPASEPVTLAQVKVQIRHALASGDTTEDDLLTGYIAAARSMVETVTGRSLMTQTWQLSLPDWPVALWLPRAVPLQSVTHVKYYDTLNALTTLSSSVYTVPAFHEPAMLTLADGQVWPALYARQDAVQIEYVTGADSAAAVPRELVQAIYLLVSHWYANRESVVVGTISQEIELAFSALVAPYRRDWREPVAA